MSFSDWALNIFLYYNNAYDRESCAAARRRLNSSDGATRVVSIIIIIYGYIPTRVLRYYTRTSIGSIHIYSLDGVTRIRQCLLDTRAHKLRINIY